VHMYARTNRAGFQKTPVTLRDNTNEGGGTMFGLVIVLYPAHGKAHILNRKPSLLSVYRYPICGCVLGAVSSSPLSAFLLSRLTLHHHIPITQIPLLPSAVLPSVK